MESSRQLSEIKDLHEKIRESAEKAKKKESVYKQLVRVRAICNSEEASKERILWQFGRNRASPGVLKEDVHLMLAKKAWH